MTDRKLEIFEIDGKFVIASHRDGTYVAPFHRPPRRMGDTTAASGSLRSVASDSNVFVYGSRATAKRALRRMTQP